MLMELISERLSLTSFWWRTHISSLKNRVKAILQGCLDLSFTSHDEETTPLGFDQILSAHTTSMLGRIVPLTRWVLKRCKIRRIWFFQEIVFARVKRCYIWRKCTIEEKKKKSCRLNAATPTCHYYSQLSCLFKSVCKLCTFSPEVFLLIL